MKIMNVEEEKELLAFAKRAGKRFAKNSKLWFYTSGDLEMGKLLALRWGYANDCVAVLRVSDDLEPRIFPAMIEFDTIQKVKDKWQEEDKDDHDSVG